MDTQRRFLRGILTLSVLACVFFTLEFLWEWDRLGRPGVEQLSYAGNSNNVKMVDVLSPMARAYNNILAMLIATVGLAIPLTANMHTPKLIDMFLRDRLNQAMLFIMALGAGNVLFVDYLVGPHFEFRHRTHLRQVRLLRQHHQREPRLDFRSVQYDREWLGPRSRFAILRLFLRLAFQRRKIHHRQ